MLSASSNKESSCMSPLAASLGGVKAIVFDVYGTLVEIQDRRRPYAQLLHWLAKAGRVPRHDDAAQVMCYLTELAGTAQRRSEEHTSELQSLMRISYAVFCLKKKKQH